LKVLGSSGPIVRSLEKIGIYSGQSRNLPSWHHFSIAQRVTFLERADRFPELVRRQDRKIYWSVGLFFFLLVGVGLYGIKERIWISNVDGMTPKALESLLKKEMVARPADTRIMMTLAMLYHEEKRLPEAKEIYDKILQVKPDHPLALNNLAWLLATCKEPALFQPARALALAQKAAALKPDPMILDTLAEAYMANGRPEIALQVARQVLAKHPSNRDYYLAQENRFKNAMKKEMK
jgi:tetratricopeptide (TPR) repeat protein